MSVTMSEWAYKLRNFWREFKRQKIGLLGLALLIILVVLAVAAPLIVNPDYEKNWNLAEYWKDNPIDAPPCWVQIFSSKKYAPQRVYVWMSNDTRKQSPNIKVVLVKKGRGYAIYNVSMHYNYLWDVPPNNIKLELYIRHKTNSTKYPVFDLYLTRPDGAVLKLANRQSMTTNITSSLSSMNLGRDIRSILLEFASHYVNTTGVQPSTIKPLQVIFSKAGKGMLAGKTPPLKGEYTFTFKIIFTEPSDKVVEARMVVMGSCYGLLGTDALGRDLFAGIIFGIKWALIIGVLTSVISVFTGVFYGIASGYAGGWTDEALMRLDQVVYSMPVLPLLILMAAIWRPSIWLIILFLAAFGWPGIAIVTRSMALQLKEELYVEAAKAMGASGWRIVFRYIVPQTMPYAFASIALSVPGAILAEAGLSYLGLGDPLAVTWGKILHDASMANAVLNNLWWWVLPPGLMIALVGLTFVFLGNALDRVLNPRLQR